MQYLDPMSNPANLLVYTENHWLPSPPGTTLPDGSMIASPGGLSVCLQPVNRVPAPGRS